MNDVGGTGWGRVNRKGSKVNCRSLEKWVWQEGVGNLPAGAVAHASGCANCRALIDQIRLLDRSVGTTIVPEPGGEYWESLTARISQRIADPSDRVIELVPHAPAWRRLLTRVWAPTAAVALLAVIAAQKPGTLNSSRVFSVEELDQRVESLTRKAEPSTLSEASDAGTSGDSKFRAARMPSPDTQASTRPNQTVPTAPQYAVPEQTERSARADGGSVPSAGVSNPVITGAAPKSVEDNDEVWPERQVTIVGEVDSNSRKAISDDGRLAAQDPFGAYERHMAVAEQGLESVGTLSTPGRLLDGPTAPTMRGSERLTPAEQMRRFDEVSELRQLIARLEEVPSTSRAMSQWTQWSTAWFRLGMLTDQSAVVDSAITAVNYFQSNVPVDPAVAVEWQNRKTQLVNRRALLVE